MLNKLLITIFFLLLVSTATVCADINIDHNGDTLIQPPAVRPGDHVTTSIKIHISNNYTDKITIPIPEIYTITYLDNTSYNPRLEQEPYKYLTINVNLVDTCEYLCYYNDFDLTSYTLNFEEGIPNSREIQVTYIFEPPVGAFSNNTGFIIENINDINLEGEDLLNSLPDWFIPAFLIVTVIAALCSFLPMFVDGILNTSSSSSERRRRRIEDDYNGTLEKIKRTHTPKPKPKPKPPVTFKCKGKKEIYELIPGDGMFDIGIKKFDNMPSYEEQVNTINNLDEVISFTESTKHATVDLKKYGKYSIKIKQTPIVKRIESNGTRSARNPYIRENTYDLCMGSGETLYLSCYKSKFYSECLKIIIELLKSEHGRGYRKWSDCGL